MLNLLFCQDQTVGTEEVLRRIAGDVAKEQGGRILMVPELISHDIERRLCAAAGDTASRFAQVLTFTRLGRRVADLVGSGAVECMDDGGRVVAMASAARQLHSRLKTYASLETKPEFLSDMVDAVDEFKRCCITSQDLMDASQKTQGILAQKLEELSLLLEAYDGICARGKRDPREQMTWVLEQMEDSDFAQNHVFYIDAFPDFTRQHMAILEHLILFSPQVTVCLNCDVPGSHAMAFEKAGETASQLLRMAQNAGVPVTKTFLPAAGVPLDRVRAALFQGPVETDAALAQHLRLIRAGSIYQECEAVAEEILRHVHHGARFREIAVACTDLAAYQSTLRLVFRRSGIPLYLAGTEDVLQSSVIDTVLAALDAALGGMEYRDVIRYLRCAMSPLDLDDCDILENYAYVWGISGQRWEGEWNFHPEGLSGQWDADSQALLQRINAARTVGISPLLRLQKALRNGVSLQQQVVALHDFLEEIRFCQRLDQFALDLETAGDLRGAQIYRQLWDILAGALEQLYDVLGTTVWDSDAFSRLLRLLLSQYHVGTIPPVLDSVTAGNVSAMRCQREKHLFILGANEGSFPGYSGATGLLTDQERVELRRIGVPLTGGSLDGLQAEFAEIYGLFCGAELSVTLSCSAEPSFVYRRLATMAGGDQAAQKESYFLYANGVDAAACLARFDAADAAARLQILPEFEQVCKSKDHCLGSIRRENVPKLYGSKLKLSASQVDRQAECRLSYFLKYGLRAKERKEATVDPAEFGTYVHDVLEHTARDVMALGGFEKVDLQQTLQIAKAHSQAYADAHFSDLDSQRMTYLFRRNMQELEMVVEALWQELSVSQYRPIRFELQFDSGAEMPAIEIPNGAMPAQLRGFVDRVDLWEHAGANYVRVVDYKTGKKDFDYCDVFNGIGLQMLLYLFALEEQGQSVAGDLIIPAGVQYFPARVPYLTVTAAEDDDWQKQRQKGMVRKGLLLEDEDSLSAMDPSEKMDTLFCKRNKDGFLTGDLADRGQMITLKRYVMHLLGKIVHDIAEGNVSPNPYTRGSSHDACTFCPYGSVCHKQSVEGRRNYKAMPAQRFWEELEKELNTNG